MRRTPQQRARETLDRAAERKADARPAIYLRPLGSSGLHQVQMRDGRIVQAAASRTQARGSEVVVVTQGGGRQRRIMEGGAPSGRQGVSLRPKISNATVRELPDLPDIPPGFGPVSGPWGRPGTLIVSRHQLVLEPSILFGIKIEINGTSGAHPTVELFGGDVVLQDATDPPDQSSPYHHHSTPGCDLAIGGWPGTWSMTCQSFGTANHDFDFPIVNKLRNTQQYIDNGRVRTFDVFPGTTEQIIVSVLRADTGTGLGGFGTQIVMTETIYEIT